MSSDVTVVIPAMPTRMHYLNEALDSVIRQTLSPDAIIVEFDSKREGAWATRNKAMLKANTKWTAFLDDDDMFMPHHLEFLRRKADQESLDLCWGWFEVQGGTDPFPNHRGRTYDPNDPHSFPISVLVKTSFLHLAYAEMGGFQSDTTGSWLSQDRPLWDHVICKQHARHAAFNETTWIWRHHATNSSGLPSKGQ